MAEIVSQIQKYKCVEEDLINLNKRFISIGRRTAKKYNKYFGEFVDMLIEELRNDKLFNRIYVDKVYTGSYFNGLKVHRPDEFDLNLIMKIPCIDYKRFIIKSHKCWPGYVTLRIDPVNYKQLSRSQWSHIGPHSMINWFDKNGYFLPNKFRCWLQSVIQKHCPLNNDEELKVEMKTSGPAITLCVSGKMNFSLDVVPVIQIKEPQWPPSPPFRPNPRRCRRGNKTCWYLIPKPLKYGHDFQVKNKNMPYWRLSFYEQEKLLMKGKNKLKPALKLIKKLKMTQGFTNISSYHINTIALWELQNIKNDELWKHASIGFIFTYLLKKLNQCLRYHWISNYWQVNYNLLDSVDETKTEDYYNKLTNIINDIERNAMCIPFYICNNYSNRKQRRRQNRRRL